MTVVDSDESALETRSSGGTFGLSERSGELLFEGNLEWRAFLDSITGGTRAGVHMYITSSKTALHVLRFIRGFETRTVGSHSDARVEYCQSYRVDPRG